MTGAGSIVDVLDPFHAEVAACIKCLCKAREMGMGNVILETDALMIKQAVETGDYDLSVMGSLIMELKFLVEFEFHNMCSVLLS